MTSKQAVKAKAAAAGQRQPERVTVQRQPAGMWLVVVDGMPLVVLSTEAARPIMLGRVTADELLTRYSPADPARG